MVLTCTAKALSGDKGNYSCDGEMFCVLQQRMCFKKFIYSGMNILHTQHEEYWERLSKIHVVHARVIMNSE